MAGEQNYTSHLCTYEEAMHKLEGIERSVLQYAWDVYHHTLTIEEQRRKREQQGRRQRRSSQAEANNQSRRSITR